MDPTAEKSLATVERNGVSPVDLLRRRQCQSKISWEGCHDGVEERGVEGGRKKRVFDENSVEKVLDVLTKFKTGCER